MANLSQTIQHLYPTSVSLRDWRVENRGNGQMLAFWSPALGPQPTQAELDAAVLPATKAQRITAINTECRARLLARFGDPAEQVSRAIGVYGLAEKAALEAGIAATIDASNMASDAVTAATTIAEVEAVTVTWPTI